MFLLQAPPDMQSMPERGAGVSPIRLQIPHPTPHVPKHSPQTAPQVHARNKPIDRSNDDALLRLIADLTIGYSGAELANLMNEGAILAVRLFLPRLRRVFFFVSALAWGAA